MYLSVEVEIQSKWRLDKSPSCRQIGR